MKTEIVSSIIAKSQNELNLRVRKVAKYSEWLQLDVMDGKFVKGKSMMFDFRLPKTKCKYEAHLMMKNPLPWIEKHCEKVDTIIFHLESFKDKKNIDKAIKLILSRDVNVGIAINPGTSFDRLKPFLDEFDIVLFMTVHPGKYGAKFLPEILGRITRFKSKYKFRGDIEVDGGINDKTIHSSFIAGANRFVVGSYFQKTRNVFKSLNKLKNLAD